MKALALILLAGCAGVRTQEQLDRSTYCEDFCCCSREKEQEKAMPVAKPAIAVSNVRE